MEPRKRKFVVGQLVTLNPQHQYSGNIDVGIGKPFRVTAYCYIGAEDRCYVVVREGDSALYLHVLESQLTAGS